MSPGDQVPSADGFSQEVTARFGVLPNFFRSAPAAPALIEELWAFAKSAYLDNPLPSLFKERLFVHLSRFCGVRYCIVRHVGFLIGEGRPAGDPSVIPHTVEQALALLRRPVPEGAAQEAAFSRLEAWPEPAELPLPETQDEADLFDALTVIFLAPAQGARARDAVKTAIGGMKFELATAFLAFVRTAHYWTETHPDLAFEPDMLTRMERHADLTKLLMDATEAEKIILADVRRRQAEALLAAQREALEAALNDAPLTASLGKLVSAAVAQYGSDTRAAVYLANAEGTALRHVVGMPDEYAAEVEGFVIGEGSLACGLAASTGKAVLTADIREDPLWKPWRHMAERYDYRGCWSFPLRSGRGGIVGTFAIYWREPRIAMAHDVELIGLLTQSAGIIIARDEEAKLRQRAGDALQDAENRLKTLMEGIPQLVWRAADGGDWTWSSPQWSAYTGVSADESLKHGWLDAVHPEDRGEALRLWGEAAAKGRLEMEGRIRRAATREYRWFQTRATPVRDPGGKIVEWLGTSTDINDLRQLQEGQKVLVGELQHRTRNLMGVVRSMVDKTARSSVDFVDFRNRFRDRLDALARVQGLLSRLSEHERVSFDQLIGAELAAVHGSSDGVTLKGPSGVRLRSSTVQTLAMALHELATNAVKYGALGENGGRLIVTWSLEASGDSAKPWLHIDWQESGVAMPPAGPAPRGSGHGRELIEQALPYQLHARSTFELGPDGVHCTISLPVSEIATAVELRDG